MSKGKKSGKSFEDIPKMAISALEKMVHTYFWTESSTRLLFE